MNIVYVGIDNGVSGSIGVISANLTEFVRTPVIHAAGYQKTVKRQLGRLNHSALTEFFAGLHVRHLVNPKDTWVKIVLERPMINSTRFSASISAARCLEATLVIIEQLRNTRLYHAVSMDYIDSKTWQKALLPPAKKQPELKELSRQAGIRLFPQHELEINRVKDADSILIAHYTCLVNNTTSSVSPPTESTERSTIAADAA